MIKQVFIIVLFFDFFTRNNYANIKIFYLNWRHLFTAEKNLKKRLVSYVNKISISRNLFKTLNLHDVEFSTINEDMHSTQLIKKIAEYYFNIRLARYGQEYTLQSLKKSSIGLRQQSNKMLLFKGLQSLYQYSYTLLDIDVTVMHEILLA